MREFVVRPNLADRLVRRRGGLHAYETYDPVTTALLVVDMQNYFLAEGHPACCPAARGIVPAVNRLAGTLRETGGTVIWVVTEADAESVEGWANFYETYGPELRAKRLELLRPGGEGCTLWADLDVRPGDETVVKFRYSAFVRASTDLEDLLRRKGMETVLVAGVATNVCCESTARDSMMRGFRTVMVSDANASFSEGEHSAALLGFITYFGDVQSTEEIVQRLRAGAARNASSG